MQHTQNETPTIVPSAAAISALARLLRSVPDKPAVVPVVQPGTGMTHLLTVKGKSDESKI